MQVCEGFRAQLSVLRGCVTPLPDRLISRPVFSIEISFFEALFFFVIDESLKEVSDFINNKT
jgi:hypothetical protein